MFDQRECYKFRKSPDFHFVECVYTLVLPKAQYKYKIIHCENNLGVSALQGV